MRNWIINILLFMVTSYSFGQNFPEGIPYQAQVYSSSGTLLSNQNIGVQFNIRENSINGNIVWQENHTVTVNDLGHFALVIGEGTSTGVGSVSIFSNLNWSTGIYFIEMLVDESNTNNYNSVITQQMMSVPYAYHSKTTDQTYKISELEDVDTTGIQVGDVLKWDGTKWVPGVDENLTYNDSILFSFYSDTSSYATNGSYALNCIPANLVDSSYYAEYSDTANYSFYSGYSNYSDSSSYADTANISSYSLGNWGLNGNSSTIANTNFVGTIDSIDFVVKSYNTEKMRIKANGDIGFGTNTPLGDFHVNNADGVLFTGNYGTGNIPTQGAGSRMMWYPGKSAFRVGTVTSNYWDDSNIGSYSIASGYNNRAKGLYSACFGYNSLASNEGSFAVGQGAVSGGLYSFAAGHNPSATGDYSIALGRGAYANNYSSIAIGYHPTSDGQYSMSLGNYTYSYGDYSIAMGYHGQAMHLGSFVFADKSTETYLQTTASNQFMVRAAGGYIFYTSSDLSTGVVLAPGAGSWSTLSDSTKKENINQLRPTDYLNKLNNIDVYSWNYKSQNDSINHIGPMAQDFYATFNLGTDSTTINTGDFDGVNLLLLKGLNEKIETIENQNDKINSLEKELELLKQKRLELEEMLIEIENQLNEN